MVEISSFQLEAIEAFRPRVAVLLNITEDHLDRYPRYADYIDAKARIFVNQTSQDVAVLNRDDPIVMRLAENVSARRNLLQPEGDPERRRLFQREGHYAQTCGWRRGLFSGNDSPEGCP